MKSHLTLFSALLGTLLLLSCKSSEKIPLYKNANASIDSRVEDLLGRMTLEEKVAQLCSKSDRFTPTTVRDQAKIDELFADMPGMLQPLYEYLDTIAEVRNTLQRHALEQTRLGIPILFTEEALHGAAKDEATSFPQAVALGSTWNPELLEEVFDIAARELRTRGGHFVFTPVVDVARDPRWGRCEECYGEDPYLAGVMGAAAVRGLQGSADGSIAKDHVAATLKHFVAHGQKEGGRNKAPANISPRLVRDLHLEPFRIAIRESNPRGVMPSYNELDGIPMHMNRHLLQDVLQDELGFKGMIVSDYSAIAELQRLHMLSPNDTISAQLAFNAGVEFDMPTSDCYKHLPVLVKEGKVKEQDIDRAVRKMLRLKFELGLFENPYFDIDSARQFARQPSHAALARKAAQESIILLKNENGILPLDTERYRRIAVIGPNANDTRIGEYSGIPNYKITVLDGLKERFPACEITYAEGCKITNDHLDNSRLTWFKREGPNTFPTREENLKRIEEAVEVARGADIVVLVLGENEMVCREAFSPTSTGDTSTLDLRGQQDELFQAINDLGKPTIVCLMHGRPLTIGNIAEKADAILDLWYAGQETGNAVADIISGDVNPSGKLTITYPKNIGQLPVWYNRKPTSARNYVDDGFGWLFPFGHGLSYSTFEYDNIRLADHTITPTGQTTLSCEVTNNSEVDGYEVVEFYIRDEEATVTRPVKELKGFKKIFLKAGEKKTVEFAIGPRTLEYWNADNRYMVEPGNFTLMIGRSSEDIRLKEKLVVK